MPFAFNGDARLGRPGVARKRDRTEQKGKGALSLEARRSEKIRLPFRCKKKTESAESQRRMRDWRRKRDFGCQGERKEQMFGQLYEQGKTSGRQGK